MVNATITKRVQKMFPGKELNAGSSFRGGNCLICGVPFKSDKCPHNVADQETAIRAVYAERLLR